MVIAMKRNRPRHCPGAAPSIGLLALITIVIAGLLIVALLYRPERGDGGTRTLFVYCAAGMRVPVEQIAERYEHEHGVSIELQFGGSNTLLSQLQVSRVGDLYLAGDATYTQLAADKGLADERLTVATMRPVIITPAGNPKNIKALDDLLDRDVKVALGNPDAAAIGRSVREVLDQTGKWTALQEHARTNGVFKPTVTDVANDVKLGSVHAGIVWNTTAAMYPSLNAIAAPELAAGEVAIEVAVLRSSEAPTAALRFARYLTARDRGLETFGSYNFDTIDGDPWAARPQLTFFCGAVNRRAVDRVVRKFAKREGVDVNVVYNGCGILTGQMKTIRDPSTTAGFPDAYMACDVYYLDTVRDWFQESVEVSDTRIVIAVPPGNPRNIQSLDDLAEPGLRVAVGQPKQCTIGVLTRQLLDGEGVAEAVMKNVVMQTTSSALLVPAVTDGGADAALAYATDTLAAAGMVETIAIDSSRAEAVQPFAIARTSPYKQLGRRLKDSITSARGSFEDAGFHWRLDATAEAADTP